MRGVAAKEEPPSICPSCKGHWSTFPQILDSPGKNPQLIPFFQVRKTRQEGPPIVGHTMLEHLMAAGFILVFRAWFTGNPILFILKHLSIHIPGRGKSNSCFLNHFKSYLVMVSQQKTFELK